MPVHFKKCTLVNFDESNYVQTGKGFALLKNIFTLKYLVQSNLGSE